MGQPASVQSPGGKGRFIGSWSNCIIYSFFLEKKNEIWNTFTLFEKWKVNLFFLSLISRVKSEMKMPWNRDREWKVKWKCLEIEIEKWNRKKILENSRETRLLQVTGMYFIYIHLSIVLELINWSSKRTAFYPLIVTDLANLFHCPSDVSWGPTRRASDGRAGTQGGTCKYNMSVQFLIHHPFKQDYKTIYRESIKHFLVGRFWHIKHESWIHSLRGDVVEGDSIVAQSTKALVLVVKSLTIKHQRWM